MECDEEYIEESTRTFGERFKEHLKALSPIYEHSNTTSHHTNVDSFNILERESQTCTRTIKEAIFEGNDLSVNRNIGKYQLPHIWDEDLVNIPELKLK